MKYFVYFLFEETHFSSQVLCMARNNAVLLGVNNIPDKASQCLQKPDNVVHSFEQFRANTCRTSHYRGANLEPVLEVPAIIALGDNLEPILADQENVSSQYLHYQPL
jgi:hypothetical protein